MAGGDSLTEKLGNCVIIIDKPPGQASHEITTFVRKITGAARAGHAGTLDPGVSGVLPVALGRATKLLRYIAGKEKTYVGIVKFRNIQGRDEVERLFARFTGELVQTPPKISAVRKIPRKRTVHYLKLLELQGRLALFETKVDAGTYIRTLCEDIGKVCGGARMVELRRTGVGKISETGAFTMHELVDAVWLGKNRGEPALLMKMLRAPEEFIDLPRVFIRESALSSVFSGAQIMAPAVERIDPALARGERAAIYAGARFVGVGIVKMDAGELERRKRGIVIKTERVHKTDAPG